MRGAACRPRGARQAHRLDRHSPLVRTFVYRSTRPSAWLPALLFAAGVIVAVLGVWTLIGWHSPLAAPTFPALFDRISYDCAWGLIFLGASAAAYGVQLEGLGRMLSAVPIILGSLRVAA